VATGSASYLYTSVGGYYNGFAGGRDYTGNIGEVLVYGGQLTAVQRQAVEAYLNYKWLGVVAPAFGQGILPSSTPMTISNGGTFDMTNGTQTIASLSSTDGLGSKVLLGGAGILTINGPANTSYDGVLTASGGSVVLQGGGQLTLTGAVPLTSNIVNNSSLVFSPPSGGLQSYFQGAISGSSAVTKNGPGTTRFMSNNAYTGALTPAAALRAPSPMERGPSTPPALA
jgi:autotransporter-associated beta strand protein